MSFVPLPFSSWLILIVPMAAVVGLIAFMTLRDQRKARFRQQTGDMLLDRLMPANDEGSPYLAGENNALQSIALLPEDVAPHEAYAVLCKAMPGSTIYDRQALMLHAWEVQKRPQALAAWRGWG